MKMETPKMDIVRFQEADVLAASGFATEFQRSRIANAGGANGNLTYTIYPVGGDEDVHEYSALVNDQSTAYAANPVFFIPGDTTGKSLKALVEDDTPGKAGIYGDYNGLYESSDGSIYHWIDQ